MLVLAGFAALISMGFATLSFYKFKPAPETPISTTSPLAPGTATPHLSPSGTRPEGEVSPQPSPALTPTPTPEIKRQTVIKDSAVALRAGQFLPYRFEIKNNYHHARLAGSISVSGGGLSKDVMLLIVDDQGLRDFGEGERTKYYFTSKVRGIQHIDVSLPPGVYHVIISNIHARFFGKKVEAYMYLEFD